MVLLEKINNEYSIIQLCAAMCCSSRETTNNYKRIQRCAAMCPNTETKDVPNTEAKCSNTEAKYLNDHGVLKQRFLGSLGRWALGLPTRTGPEYRSDPLQKLKAPYRS